MSNQFSDMTRARVRMLASHPFFGMLALRLKLVEEPGVPTAGVDGTHLFYNPEWVKKLSLPQLQGLMAHEVMHCVFDHISRRGAREARRWNVAGDFAINHLLLEAGLQLPPGGCVDKQYAGMTVDEIYMRLPASATAPKDDEFVCEVLQGTPSVGGAEPTTANDSVTANTWKVNAAQAAMIAKQSGNLPASLERLIGEMLEPQVDWREQLRHLMTETSKDDYSWMRPSRRHVAEGIYLPSLHSQSAGRVVVAIDTSGSITNEMLQVFGSEVAAVCSSVLPAAIDVIYCDARVNHVDHFDKGEEATFKMHGGGGTAFDPPFTWVAEQGFAPVCFIYFTDGYGSFNFEPPPYPVIWCMTTDVEAPWGQNLRVRA